MRSIGAERFVEALLAYVECDLQVGSGAGGAPLTEDSYLFEIGRIDSLKILQLIAFVEQWTGAPIAEADIVMANFRSVRTIAERFVR